MCVAIFEYLIGKIIIPSCMGWGEVVCVHVLVCVHVRAWCICGVIFCMFVCLCVHVQVCVCVCLGGGGGGSKLKQYRSIFNAKTVSYSTNKLFCNTRKTVPHSTKNRSTFDEKTVPHSMQNRSAFNAKRSVPWYIKPFQLF